MSKLFFKHIHYYHICVIIMRELFNKLDDEHGEEEGGKQIVCKKHLSLSLRAINENIDENPEVCISLLLRATNENIDENSEVCISCIIFIFISVFMELEEMYTVVLTRFITRRAKEGFVSTEYVG